MGTAHSLGGSDNTKRTLTSGGEPRVNVRFTKQGCQTSWMFAACMPFGPRSASNETFWFSSRLR